MAKRVVFGGLLAFLGACGGSVETSSSTGDPVLAPPPARPSEQGIYRPASPGGPDHIADGLGSPSALAMTDDRVIFTTRSTTIGGERVEAGALFIADKRVGPALMLAVDRQGASFDALAADDATAFVATSDGRLLGVPVLGGSPTIVASLDAPAVALATSGGYVYYATSGGALARVAKKGGAVEPLAALTGAVRGLQADEAAVYVGVGARASEESPAGILRVSLDGAVKVLAAGAEPCAMIRDRRNLYWTSLGAGVVGKGEVLRLSLDGGNVATVASGAFSACAIAADKDSLYFATALPSSLPGKAGGAGTSPTRGLGLMRAPIAGGEPVAVALAARALTQPGAVAVDATHVYWLTETSVLRLRK